MANKNLKKVALGVGIGVLGMSQLNGQTYKDTSNKNNYSTNKSEEVSRDSESNSKWNFGAGYYPSTEQNGFLEASYQVKANDFSIGPYVKFRNQENEISTQKKEFDSHIINDMYSLTEEFTKTKESKSQPVELGLKMSQRIGPLELSLNGGLTQTEKWAQRAVYGNDKIIDNGELVRKENFNLPMEETPRTKSIDFSGSAELLVKPFRWLGIGAGIETNGNGYLTGRITFGGVKK